MLSRWKKECWFWITEIIWARSHKSKSEIALQRWWPHRSYKSSDEQHPGFARGHPPYYWPGSKEFNFRDQTRAGAVSMIWPFMSTLLIVVNNATTCNIFFKKNLLNIWSQYLSCIRISNNQNIEKKLNGSKEVKSKRTAPGLRTWSPPVLLAGLEGI